MRNVCLLGATGSIGTQTLDLIREKSDEYKLVAIAFGHKVDAAEKIIEEFKPLFVACKTKEDAKYLQNKYGIMTAYGRMGLSDCATFECENPVVVNSLVGSSGLLPTLEAIEKGRDVYLANKETLVIGGEIVMAEAKEYGVKIIPIDSEHSAIAQIIEGRNHSEIKRLLVTASGGAFRDKSRDQLEDVTASDALAHPNWKMGPKITIDCATMMNKGFELIEAHYLFNIPMDRIEPVLHRESIVHSMVEFDDGAIFAQIGSSDMHLPIKYALEGPSHSASKCIEPLDLIKMSTLHFGEVSTERYPCLAYALEAINKGGIYPTVLNAANEAAVGLFLKGKIKFLMIEKIIREELDNSIYEIMNQQELSVLRIMYVDGYVKERVLSTYGKEN